MRKAFPRQRSKFKVTARRSFGETSVDNGQRYAAFSTGVVEIRPDLGFQHHRERRSIVPNEAVHATGEIVRQIDMSCRIAEHPFDPRRPCRRCSGNEYGPFRKSVLDRANQRKRGLGFADRHRMEPDDTGFRIRIVERQPFAPALGVTRLLASSPIETCEDNRRENVEQG